MTNTHLTSLPILSAKCALLVISCLFSPMGCGQGTAAFGGSTTTDYPDQIGADEPLGKSFEAQVTPAVSSQNGGFADYIAEAKNQSPAVQSAKLQAQSADIEALNARFNFGPTPYLNSGLDPRTGQGTATLGVSQPIWTGGKLTASRDLADVNAKVAANRPSLVGEQLSSELVSAYGAWISAYLLREIWQRNLGDTERILKLIVSQEAQGFASQEELTLAQKRMASQRALAQNAGASLISNSQKIEQILGRNADENALRDSIDNFPKPDISDPAALLAQALERSPVLTDLDLRQQQSDVEVRVAKADLFPDLVLNIEKHQPKIGNGFHDSETRVNIGFQTNFGASFSKPRKVQQAILASQSARYDRVSVEREIRFDVQSAIADYQNALADEKIFSDLERSSQAILNSYIRQFDQLERSWEEILSAQTDLADARAELAQAKAQKIAAAWKIALHTGRF